MSDPVGPSPGEPGEITQLLQEASQGRKEAFDRVLPLIYQELNRIARNRLRLERPGHTLSTTALVHEAYLRLVGQTRVEWRNRNQFFAVASDAMRRILIDHAKRSQAAKRGGGADNVPIDAIAEFVSADVSSQAEELLALDEALTRLAEFNPDGARVVQYRFFGGLSNDEVADVLGVSERSVRRMWTVAKAWLRKELDDSLESGAGAFMSRSPLAAS